MPINLTPEMSIDEITDAVLHTYGHFVNYEEYDKDTANGVFFTIPSWIEKDKGAYARQAQELIKAKRGVKS